MGVILFHFESFVPDGLFKFLNNTVNNSKLFNIALKTSPDPTLPTLCIVTRIYWEQISYFPVLALGLYHSGLHNIRIYVINTDKKTDVRQLGQTIQFINELVLREDFVTFLDLGESPSGNDYGYGMTDHALTYLYKQNMHSPSICQYVTFTNGDNFYSRDFATKLLPHMKAEKDIIAWDFISHHRTPRYQLVIDNKIKRVPEIIDDGTDKCIPIDLRVMFADLGAVAYRLSFLRKHNLYFVQSSKNLFNADGSFVEQAAGRTNESVLLKQTLFVHQ
jgi:hypothetical protein